MPVESITPELREEARRLVRSQTYFKDYIRAVHGWEIRPHQESWVAALQALAYGRLRDANDNPLHRVLILAPPASGKTSIVLQFASWLIGREVKAGRDPQVGMLSYAEDVARERSVAIRNVVEFNETYRKVFMDVKPAKADGWSEGSWYIARKDRGTASPTLRSAGLEGAILSYRFPTLIVVDDPHNPRQLGPGDKDAVWETWNSVVKTRGVETTPTVLLMTRWAGDDLAGRIIDQESGWYVIDSPVPMDWGEGDESYWPLESDELGTYGISKEALLDIKIKRNTTFLTQYQCRPPGASGGMFQWWSFAPDPEPADVKAVYHSWDTAYTAGRHSSYQALTEWVALRDGKIYLAGAFKVRCEFPILLEHIQRLAGEAQERWGSRPVVLVEAKASGPAVVQMLRMHTPLNITDVTIKNEDLVPRAAAVSQWFQSGRVLLPEASSVWRTDYMKQMREFPYNRGRDDDWVASTVLTLEYLYGHYIGPPPDVKIRWGRW